ncbi:hypothetical protein NUW54_g14181 [Trametes sanguinea]|uniref:Uncharacterized protein n=1 Tax=Trametes sanguinea TaxID=158606 RepID=A0ACC1MEI0_9APHY|nr:hypothetical protein NUW54_g14181 [Trametes sanguinea]
MPVADGERGQERTRPHLFCGPELESTVSLNRRESRGVRATPIERAETGGEESPRGWSWAFATVETGVQLCTRHAQARQRWTYVRVRLRDHGCPVLPGRTLFPHVHDTCALSAGTPVPVNRSLAQWLSNERAGTARDIVSHTAHEATALPIRDYSAS